MKKYTTTMIDFLEHPSMIYEIEQTDKKQIKQKDLIVIK